MSGGRLTQQERQQIALGLADGLAYAEIARRLDRPTSTITREVMRNGGPTAYRADLAHRATERRTHRRKRSAPRAQRSAGTGPRARRRGRARVRRVVHHAADAPGPAQDDGPGADLPVHRRRGQPHRVRTRPAPPGQPGVRLQGDRVPRRARASSAGNATIAAASATSSTTTSGTSRRSPAPAASPRSPRQHDRASRPRPRHPGRHPPGERRPLQRLHQRKHPPRRRTGPRSPPHETRTKLNEVRTAGWRGCGGSAVPGAGGSFRGVGIGLAGGREVA